jgi:hypothetical protein
VAERSGFRATARHDEVLAYVDQLEKMAPHVWRIDFGATAERRPLSAIVISQPRVHTAADARASDKLIVLLIGNIHAGECDGKEALLALARDLALRPDDPLLERLILLIVPNFNADGNERMAAGNRPGQVGPDVMGRRENAQGLDLNRDFIKLETPEVRALVRLMNQWDPHVFIDCHTTNGSRHRYALTFDSPHNLAAAEAPREFMRDAMLPEVMRRLEAKGLSTFFYGNFDRQHTRWTSYGHEPRYGIEYVGLCGRIAILAESYSYIPYKDRIEATGAFVRECLAYLAENAAGVHETLDLAAQRTIAAGLDPDGADRVAIQAKLVARREKAVVKGFEPEPRPAPATNTAPNSPGLDGTPKDYTVEHVDRCEATLQVARPFAYSIPVAQSRVADLLIEHGLEIEQLTESAACEVEVVRVEKSESAATPYQGHRTRTTTTSTRREQFQLPAQTYIVRTAQPLGNLAIYLLEPASDDGLDTWNFFDHAVRAGADHPVLRLPTAVKLPTRPLEQIGPAGSRGFCSAQRRAAVVSRPAADDQKPRLWRMDWKSRRW